MKNKYAQKTAISCACCPDLFQLYLFPVGHWWDSKPQKQANIQKNQQQQISCNSMI
jgi:hypothetical protein